MKRLNFVLCMAVLVLTFGVGMVLISFGNSGLAVTDTKAEDSSTQNDSSAGFEESGGDSSLGSSEVLSSSSSSVSNKSSSSQVQSSQPAPQSPAVPPPSQSSESSTSTVTFPVNINTATKEELMALPEIDEEKARVILEFRKKAGGFDSTEDIKQALWNYDGTAIYHKIKDLIVCE